MEVTDGERDRHGKEKKEQDGFPELLQNRTCSALLHGRICPLSPRRHTRYLEPDNKTDQRFRLISIGPE